MDSQFNSLLRSYSDNYIQFKVTGNPVYQQGYTSAQQGLDRIIDQLQTMVDSEKQQIANFYKSGVEQRMLELNQRNKFLERGIVSEKDEATAATMRASTPPSTFTVQPWQYITLGVLGAISVGLMIL